MQNVTETSSKVNNVETKILYNSNNPVNSQEVLSDPLRTKPGDFTIYEFRDNPNDIYVTYRIGIELRVEPTTGGRVSKELLPVTKDITVSIRRSDFKEYMDENITQLYQYIKEALKTEIDWDKDLTLSIYHTFPRQRPQLPSGYPPEKNIRFPEQTKAVVNFIAADKRFIQNIVSNNKKETIEANVKAWFPNAEPFRNILDRGQGMFPTSKIQRIKDNYIKRQENSSINQGYLKLNDQNPYLDTVRIYLIDDIFTDSYNVEYNKAGIHLILARDPESTDKVPFNNYHLIEIIRELGLPLRIEPLTVNNREKLSEPCDVTYLNEADNELPIDQNLLSEWKINGDQRLILIQKAICFLNEEYNKGNYIEEVRKLLENMDYQHDRKAPREDFYEISSQEDQITILAEGLVILRLTKKPLDNSTDNSYKFGLSDNNIFTLTENQIKEYAQKYDAELNIKQNNHSTTDETTSEKNKDKQQTTVIQIAQTPGSQQGQVIPQPASQFGTGQERLVVPQVSQVSSITSSLNDAIERLARILIGNNDYGDYSAGIEEMVKNNISKAISEKNKEDSGKGFQLYMDELYAKCNITISDYMNVYHNTLTEIGDNASLANGDPATLIKNIAGLNRWDTLGRHTLFFMKKPTGVNDIANAADCSLNNLVEIAKKRLHSVKGALYDTLGIRAEMTKDFYQLVLILADLKQENCIKAISKFCERWKIVVEDIQQNSENLDARAGVGATHP